MEESPESAETLTTSDPVGKIHELLTESDNETGQISFGEEMIEERMQELYKEIACSPVTQPASLTEIPVSSSFSTMSSISPRLIDHGRNGSCGASVSDSASTVMAGIDVISSAGRLPVGMPETESGSSSSENGGEKTPRFGEEKKMEGCECDGGDSYEDDEWLGRVLSWGQAQLETRQWF